MRPRAAAAVVLLAVIAWVAAHRAAGSRPGAQPQVHAPDASAVTNRANAAAVTNRANAAADWLHGAVAHVTSLIGWAAGHPVTVGVVVGLLLAVAIVRFVRAHRPVAQDPQRMYTAEQRREAFARAGGRCEYTGVLLAGCRQPAEHADHLHPWSRGGATSLQNCVASCSTHNLSKGAKILPAWRVRLLVRRRRRYFPPGVDTAVGERYAQRVAGRVAV